ncbi:hypothetical protein SCHPADRAFT_893001 [Schizopora paradoxa]|uniref:Uncharacterized protein n=1 Tax=Schizopora paradoxa TaxID=27342 RepID=A0A0H2RCI6_9AGAM|nr:hypothetical protein SCHPADRAFT_893001 [Schizopora paradoxa]
MVLSTIHSTPNTPQMKGIASHAPKKPPIGRLAMWSPVTGLHAYTWLRPVGGPVAIDWVTAAWSVVLHELLGMWIMGPPKIVTAIEDEHLISVDESVSEIQHQAQQPQRSKSLLYLSGMLCLLVLPSYSFDGLPLPIVSSFTTPISMACALPLPSTVENENNKPSIDNYILETHRLTPLAKVVLWPEVAVRLQTPERRAYVIEQVQNNAQASVVAVSFEDLIPNKMQNGSESGPWRHGMMIIDKDGLKAEYYKRVPVPFVEERSTSSKNKPLFFEYELVLRRNSRKVPIDWVDLPITAGFSLDFASNFPFSLSSRPALILGAAHTWHPSVGIALWEQAKARSEELGSALLWCDGGEGGVSGVAAPGVDEILQIVTTAVMHVKVVRNSKNMRADVIWAGSALNDGAMLANAIETLRARTIITILTLAYSRQATVVTKSLTVAIRRIREMNEGEVLRAKNATKADRGTYTSAGREIKDFWIVLNEGLHH